MKLNKKQIDWLNNHVDGSWKLNLYGLVDVDGDFDCGGTKISDFMRVSFGKVTGDFTCSNNKLRSLKGAPQEVGYDFSCEHNQLDSLEGIPKKYRSIYISRNNLELLEGIKNLGAEGAKKIYLCYETYTIDFYDYILNGTRTTSKIKRINPGRYVDVFLKQLDI